MPEKSKKIAATPAKIWAVLADFPAIVSWAPNVNHSTAATEARGGIGAVRRVQSGRITLLESVIDWQPNELLSYTLDGLPPIAGSVVTTWTLDKLDDTGDKKTTKVTITTTIFSRPNPISRFVGRALGRQLGRAAKQMLGGLAARVEEGTAK